MKVIQTSICTTGGGYYKSNLDTMHKTSLWQIHCTLITAPICYADTVGNGFIPCIGKHNFWRS